MQGNTQSNETYMKIVRTKRTTVRTKRTENPSGSRTGRDNKQWNRRGCRTSDGLSSFGRKWTRQDKRSMGF